MRPIRNNAYLTNQIREARNFTGNAPTLAELAQNAQSAELERARIMLANRRKARVARLACIALTVFVMVAMFYGCTN